MGIGNGDLLNLSIFFRGLDPFNDPADLVMERPTERNCLFPFLDGDVMPAIPSMSTEIKIFMIISLRNA